MGDRPDFSVGDIEPFIAYWSRSSGAERANYQLFIEDLCRVLDVPRPSGQMGMPSQDTYVFERSVEKIFDNGKKTTRFIDLYKQGCFVLEAKQSSKRNEKKDGDQLDLLGTEPRSTKKGSAVRGTGGWDTKMLAALNQAREYAQLLPEWPPFLVIVDVGNVIELWADFSGQGKRYAQFPDRQGYRIDLNDLRDEAVQERLRAVWTDPGTLDPTKRAAEVTRDIAERLARVARTLETQGSDPQQVAEFLMRCLFTMFAEDVELLPKGCFTELLEKNIQDPTTFKPALQSLWQAMNIGGYAGPINGLVKKFNGWLFKDPRALDLPGEAIHELWVASKRDWQEVEPAIFGTLLERALDKRERSRLGAHYTPRAYVERLVQPTIMEPLTEDWANVQAEAKTHANRGELIKARDTISAFHAKLCHTRVLDPACGTGNFLYMSMELMKRLEGEVLDRLTEVAGPQKMLTNEGATVHPTQFMGLEINPRAVEIAHLVVWIGFLKWQIRTNGLPSITEPVLDRTDHIFHRDAVLAYDSENLARDDHGKPLSRWDGVTMKPHPVTGEAVPDETARTELYTYTNPHWPDWPEAEFIIGNPPFIGGKDLRAELGGGYAEALWAANPKMPKAADFVTYWWDRAAELLTRKKTPLRRFGLITTNSITQTFSRRVLERHLNGKPPVHLAFAIPDHPWLKASDKAAVRIAMTVAAPGKGAGTLATVVREEGLNTDTPMVMLRRQTGVIRANLTLGADLSATTALLSNEGISSPGVKLHGSGFIVTPAEAKALGLGSVPDLDAHILPYRNGNDMTQTPRGVMVIDLYPLTIAEVRDRFPAVFQWVSDRVKSERDTNRRETYKKHWWIFGEARREMRDFLAGLSHFISTVETSKHRLFWMLDADIRPDNRLVNFGSLDWAVASVLTSRTHVRWSLSVGGTLEDRPVYNKTSCFDPFPFPNLPFGNDDASDPAKTALLTRLGDLGARLDQHRKDRQAEHDDLTMTGLYNVLERVRGLEWGTETEPLTAKEQDIYQRGLVGVLKELHDDIDRAVFEAYGWRDLGDKLVGRPGATMPIDVKAPGQEEAEEDLLGRLVALNRERAEEEKRGTVRWLRPDYQIPRFGQKLPKQEQFEAEMDAPLAPTTLPAWPKDQLEQIKLVRGELIAIREPASAADISARFKGGRNRRDQVARVLETLVALGQATSEPDSDRTFIVS